MKVSVKLFQPFEETELRIRVTVELLAPGTTFDCFIMDARAADSELDPELELLVVRRARQLLAVASHSLSCESADGRAAREAPGDDSHDASVSAVTPAA